MTHTLRDGQRFLSSHREAGLFWFRVYGRGLCIRDISRHQPSFSERNGYARGWLITRLR